MENYNPFELFGTQWALVTAGSLEKFNTCTVSWGTMGTLWIRPGKSGNVLTVYLQPSRYTYEFVKSNDCFTVSFLPEQYRKAMAYLGTHSGRKEDKVFNSGLTPKAMGDSVSYEEAELTFLCRKLYAAQLLKDAIDPEVQEYYKSKPQAYPIDENGDWEPHWMFVGEILDIEDKRA